MQNIQNKGHNSKIFRNKDLACQRALKMVLGSFEVRLGGWTHLGAALFGDYCLAGWGSESVMGRTDVLR